MTKNNLFKAIGIVILAYILISWIVPIIYGIAGISGEVSHQIGFASIMSVILETFSGFGAVILYVLLVGAFYGVLKVTGAYDKVMDFLSSKAEGREKGTLIAIIIGMAIISSVCGLDLALLVVFPILIGLVVKMGFDKLVAVSATVGATIVGMYGATFASTLYGYNNTVLGLKTYDYIVPKLIFFVVGVALLVVFVLLYSKKQGFKFAKKNAVKKATKPASKKKVDVVEKTAEYGLSSKSRLIALILVILLGALGIHRFYVGKKKSAILYLLTLGFVGIGIICDLILIIKGRFTDSNEKILSYWIDANFIKGNEIKISSKSRLVVTLLSGLLGTLGIHRFYLGKVGTGILYLLTGGIFGIGAFVDFLMALFGEAKDKEGKLIYCWTDAEKASKKVLKSVSLKPEKDTFVVQDYVPGLAIIAAILFIFVLGTTAWEGIFGSNWFNTAHTGWTGFKIGGFEILNKLFGGVDAFGTWATPARFQVYSMMLILGMVAVVAIYRTKIEDAFEGFVDGLKSFVIPAIITLLISSVFVFVYYNPVLTPLTDLLLKATDGFNVALSGIYVIINSVFYVDYYYLAYAVLYGITQTYTDKSVLSILSVMFTNLYSLVMLVAPTSVLLLVTLSISDVKYTDWFKFIWKLALALFVVSFIVFSIMLLV